MTETQSIPVTSPLHMESLELLSGLIDNLSNKDIVTMLLQIISMYATHAEYDIPTHRHHLCLLVDLTMIFQHNKDPE